MGERDQIEKRKNNFYLESSCDQIYSFNQLLTLHHQRCGKCFHQKAKVYFDPHQCFVGTQFAILNSPPLEEQSSSVKEDGESSLRSTTENKNIYLPSLFILEFPKEERRDEMLPIAGRTGVNFWRIRCNKWP